MRARSEESPATVVVEAYSARLAVSVSDPGLLEPIGAGLPAGWAVRPADLTDQEEVRWRFSVVRDGDVYRVTDSRGQETRCTAVAEVISELSAELRGYVGHHATDYVFVHAGVVAVDGRAIMLPGRSFAGKSTLVDALVRAGADYYSDEYAIIDARGLVTQHLWPIVLRDRSADPERPVGPVARMPPVPVALVALATYQPGARWSPQRLTTAAAVVAITEHALSARERPAETFATLRAAVQDALVLGGPRGDADETAHLLLERLARP